MIASVHVHGRVSRATCYSCGRGDTVISWLGDCDGSDGQSSG